jgi:hypothetical protein
VPCVLRLVIALTVCDMSFNDIAPPCVDNHFTAAQIALRMLEESTAQFERSFGHICAY